MRGKFTDAGYPIVTKNVIIEQVRKRSNIDRAIITDIYEIIDDVMRESLLAGCEVQIPNICFLTFRKTKPRPAGLYYNSSKKERIEYPDRQGYYRLNVRATPIFKAALKKSTLYGDKCTPEEWKEWKLKNGLCQADTEEIDNAEEE